MLLVLPGLLFIAICCSNLSSGFSLFAGDSDSGHDGTQKTTRLDTSSLSMDASVPSNRGVGERSIVVNSKAFECDGGRVLKGADVNNGFCDCEDGSDEPGTSACSRSPGSSFHCMNEGYRVVPIPASRVDDGVCDCCDGSDEGNIVSCSNVCVAVAQTEMASLQKMRADFKAGAAIRDDYIRSTKVNTLTKLEKTGRLAVDIQHIRSDLDKKREALNEKQAEVALVAKEQVERRYESIWMLAAAPLGLDKSSDEQLPTIALSLMKLLEPSDDTVDRAARHSSSSGDIVPSHGKYDSDEDTDVYVPDEYDDRDYPGEDEHYSHEEAGDLQSETGDESHHLHEPEDNQMAPTHETQDSAEHTSSSNPDDWAHCAVPVAGDPEMISRLRTLCSSIGSNKHMLRRFITLLAYEQAQEQGFDPERKRPQPVRVLHLLLKKYGAGADAAAAESATRQALPQGMVTDYCPKDIFIQETCDSHRLSIMESLEQLTELKPEPSSAPGWSVVEGLRTAIDAQEKGLQTLENEKQNIDSVAEIYNKNKDVLEWLHLKDQCYEQRGGKFTYEVCVMGGVKQTEDGAGHSVQLGSFDSIEKKDNGQVLMKYRNGQHCHAFGARSADVLVTCGAESSLSEALEPSTCFYTFTMTSPAACSPEHARHNRLEL